MTVPVALCRCDLCGELRRNLRQAALTNPAAANRAVNREQANERARNLLLSFLDEKQQYQLQRWGSFEVVGSDGHLYSIDTTGSYSGNVSRSNRQLCCYPNYAYYTYDSVPTYDLILGQLLAIKTDAANFSRTAR